jgi:WD40 repeat protein
VKQFSDAICAGSLLGAPSTQFSHVAFSPDETRLINAGGGSCATVWKWQQIPSAQPVFRGSGSVINSIAFSSDGDRAVTGGNDGNAVVWDTSTGAIKLTLKNKDTASTRAGFMALFTADAKQVLTGGSFQDPALWNALNGSLLRRLSFDKHQIVINDTIRAGAGRGNRVVTLSSNGWGALWDVAEQKQLASLHTEDGAIVRALSFSRDGSEFVVADASGFAFVFDSLKGALRRKVGAEGTSLAAAGISPKDDRAFTADSSGHITIWNLGDGRALLKINTAAGAPAVNDVHFSPDGSRIIAACADNKIRTWNSETGQPELTVAEETVPGEIEMPAIAGFPWVMGAAVKAGMLQVLYSPDGAFIAGTNESGHILVWDAGTGKQLLRLEGHTGRVTSLAFNPDGTRLGSSSEDGTARIWDMSLDHRAPAEIEKALAAIHQKLSR